jgi:hypothetical protein
MRLDPPRVSSHGHDWEPERNESPNAKAHHRLGGSLESGGRRNFVRVGGSFFINVLLFSLFSFFFFFVVKCTAMTMMTMGDGLDGWMDGYFGRWIWIGGVEGDGR